MKFWKIYCMEDDWPGLWLRWFRAQAIAVGWAAKWGYTLSGPSSDSNWSKARNVLNRIEAGDKVVVTLKNNRVGRIGEITRMKTDDEHWEPMVSGAITLPMVNGAAHPCPMGSRIQPHRPGARDPNAACCDTPHR